MNAFSYGEEETLTDSDSSIVIFRNPLTKHYTGTWNFVLDVTRKEDGQKVTLGNKANVNGPGISSMKKRF